MKSLTTQDHEVHSTAALYMNQISFKSECKDAACARPSRRVAALTIRRVEHALLVCCLTKIQSGQISKKKKNKKYLHLLHTNVAIMRQKEGEG